MTLLQDYYIQQLESFFDRAERNESKLIPELLELEGMSGIKTRHFYNNLLTLDDARYLEIGTWKGSSVCSAMYGNKAKILCIDNWAEFSGPKAEFLVNFETYKGVNDAHFLEQDCFKVDVNTLGKFNLYMYDGHHSEESHYRALTHYRDCLDGIFIYAVDDWNWENPRHGTTAAIADLKLEVVWSREVYADINGHDDRGWWNGIGVFLLKKP